jgi:hypothetical protein
LLALTLLLHLGCGSGAPGGGNTSQGTASITSVSIRGPAFTEVGLCATFTATVTGTGNFSQTVSWYVDGAAGGTSASGLIDSGGNYCPPATPPATNPVSIKAVAAADASKSGTATTTVIELQISPTQAQLTVGTTQQFSATIAGASNSSVIWEVNGVPGGTSATGTISQSGLYTAPQQFTDIALQVEAVSALSASIYAGADIDVSALVVISPSNVQLSYGGSQQFVGQIVGAGNAPLNWQATYGNITASGLYTATAAQTPDTITAWTPNARGTTSVQIVGLKPVITAISPQPATAGDQLTITGLNLNGAVTAVFSDSLGGPLPVANLATNGNSATVTVPQGSVTGSFYVQSQQGALAPLQSNSVHFQRLARLRIRSTQNDVGEGESVVFQYALLGDSTPQTVIFSTDQGSFSGSTYLAPPSITSDSFAHITGCISGTQSCDTLLLGLHPFRISPAVPLVALGQSLQLSAVGSSSAINWNLLAGGGSLQSSGLYSAGATLQAGGPALISGVSSGAMEQTSVGVTGAFPGLVNRIYDYVDQNSQVQHGTYSLGMAVVGNRLYVSASNELEAYNDSYFWIDVYDITNPLNPTWVTAVESNSAGPLFPIGQYLYSYDNVDLAVPGFPSTITVYSIKSGVPALQARAAGDQFSVQSENQGILAATGLSGSMLAVTLYTLTGGTIDSTNFTLPLPSDANTFSPDASLVVGNRLFVSVDSNSGDGGYILTYDLSSSPPNLLGKINARSLGFYSSGNLLFGALGGMEIYDISGQLPVQQGYVDGINAKELVGTELLAETEQQGCQVVDVTNPESPQVTGILFDGVIGPACDGGVFVGSYVYAEQNTSGIVIYDASETGGPLVQASLYGGPVGLSVAYDQVLEGNDLYAAASTGLGATLNIYDLTSNPINLTGQYVDETQQGFAVQVASNYVYFGMNNNLAVLEATQPSSPSLVATIQVPTISLAVAGNTLYAGSNNRLVVMDISNPAQPVIVTTLNLPDLPIKLRISGNLLFVADNVAGLLIYNISSPQSPVLLSTTSGFALAADVAIQGTTVFVAADVSGLVILNVSNPSQPVLLSQTGLSGTNPFYYQDSLNEASAVALNNGLVYVGTVNDNSLMFGLDYTNLGFPRIVSVYAYYGAAIFSLSFNGTELFAGGAFTSVYPIVQVDMSQPLDSINQYFPPVALQHFVTPQQSLRRLRRPATLRPMNRFHSAR